MTPVPLRNKVVGSGRRKQQKLPVPVLVSEEESVQDESVTRCVCGESHSIGLMVCCDQCEVWQHCECMGLEEQEIPEQYFCEQCKPSDHVQVKGYDKTRRYYKPSLSPTTSDSDKGTTKRRTTFNSRETSISLDEVLAFRTAIEQSKTFDASGIEILDSIQDAVTVLQDYDGNETISTRQVRPKRQNKKLEERPLKKPCQLLIAATIPVIQTPVMNKDPLFEHFSQSARETSPPAKIRLPSDRMSIIDMNKRANQILEYICSIQVEIATSKRKRSAYKDEEEEDGDEEDVENAKRRHLIEAQISETIMKIEQEVRGKENNRPTPILIPGKFDYSSCPSSSLSSASTIPLNDDRLLVDIEKSIAEEALERKSEQSSIEIMDILTRQVITFQRRFGCI